MVHVHAMIMNAQLQSISKVPRESGDETKLVEVSGVEHFVSNVVYPCAKVAKKSSPKLRSMEAIDLGILDLLLLCNYFLSSEIRMTEMRIERRDGGRRGQGKELSVTWLGRDINSKNSKIRLR